MWGLRGAGDVGSLGGDVGSPGMGVGPPWRGCGVSRGGVESP